MVTKTFNDLYAHELQALLSAEGQMIALLPSLAEGTETEELRQSLLAQVETCERQAETLRHLLMTLGERTNAPASRGMRALLEECSELLKSFALGNLRDAVMIAHMQRAEHYKQAAYASLQEYAKLLGFKEAAEALGQAARTTTGVSRNLGAIAIQVNAEAYVDTRIEKT